VAVRRKSLTFKRYTMPVTFKDDVGGGAESQLTGNLAEEEEAPLKEIGWFGSMSLGTYR